MKRSAEQKNKWVDFMTLGKQISEIENIDLNSKDLHKNLIDSLNSYETSVHIVGLSGPPGAGKSTIIGQLVSNDKYKQRIGVICLDPASPYNGAALLGDRVRMMDYIGRTNNVFIRSLSMGAYGNPEFIFMRLLNIVRLFGSYNFNRVIIEGVGGGQLDFLPLLISLTKIIVFTPTSGDMIQMMKSGVMEMADIFVVNKSDFQNHRLVYNDLLDSISILHPAKSGSWQVPVIETNGLNGDGIEELQLKIKEHKEYLINNKIWGQRLKDVRETEFKETLKDLLINLIDQNDLEKEEFSKVLREYKEGKTNLIESTSEIKNLLLSRWD